MRMTPNYSYLFPRPLFPLQSHSLLLWLTKSLSGCRPAFFVSTLPKHNRLICPNQENSFALQYACPMTLLTLIPPLTCMSLFRFFCGGNKWVASYTEEHDLKVKSKGRAAEASSMC